MTTWAINTISNYFWNDFSIKDLIIIGISFLISLLFHLLTKKQIASYINKSDEFVYEYRNGLWKKFYTKRNINKDYEKKISKNEFEKMRNTLGRRTIP